MPHFEYFWKGLILLVCLAPMVDCSFLCQNCLNLNFQFTCNNLGCDGFQISITDQASFIAKTQVACNGGGNSCFYQASINNTTVTYLFCNYTMSNCNNCQNNLTCSSCANGFYLYTYDVRNNFQNCQTCAGSMPGCMLCNGQIGCTQCLPNLMAYNGLCYYLNNTMYNGPQQYVGGGSTAAEIVRAVLILLIMIVIIIGIYLKFCKKQTPPQSKDPMLHQ